MASGKFPAARRWMVAAALMAATAGAFGQDGPHLRHRVFLQWGYNRAQFSTSDIRFTGPGYDFTLNSVVAKDRPEPFSLNGYFNPKYLWIPQYNYRAGWFPSERWSISIGLDHMKYVMVRGQQVAYTGHLGDDGNGRQYAGSGQLDLTPDLLTYEHTDGLNLLSVELDHYLRLWHSGNGLHALYFTPGLFAGPVIPRTDVRLFGEGLNNRFHLAGYGIGAQAGIFALVHDRIFVRARVHAGFINLPDVLTTGTADERAKQHFYFIEEQVVLGVLIGRGKP
ncbi:MAG: hypothetical protein M9900_00865 [Flavobacteriales bacterium]|nr:hypothetical protein [Flavobacteriales bacterium]